MAKIPVLEEEVQEDFSNQLLARYLTNPSEEPILTIRKEWLPQIEKENPLYIRCLNSFTIWLIERYDDKGSASNVRDIFLLGYKILGEQAIREHTPMPIVDENIFRRVNSKFPMTEGPLLKGIFEKIHKENPLYQDYIESLLLTTIENDAVRHDAQKFSAFCYTLLDERLCAESCLI